MRNTVVINFINRPESKLVHFCCHEVLSGSNNDIWFPIHDENQLFVELEKIMINCRVANNITHIEDLRRDSNGVGFFADYKITYNER